MGAAQVTPPATLEARVLALEAEAESFSAIARAAEDAKQFAPAVSALVKAGAIASEIAKLRDTIVGMRIRDPVKRIEHDLVRAEAAADWQAVAALFRKLDAAKADAEAKAQAEADAAKRAKSPIEKAEALGDLLVAMPAKLRKVALARLNLDRVGPAVH